MIKIGFIFFDDLHIIHHFIGPAVALDKNPNVEVSILTTEREHTYLFSLLELLNTPKSIVKKLPTYWYRKIIEKIKNRKKPTNKYLFENNEKLLLDYDVLVFNDGNHEFLYSKREDKKPKFVMLMHGAGDREYLIGKSFKEKIGKFDLITTSGQKVNEFYKAMQLTKTKLDICGYQKFDVVKIENKNISYFSNGKPTLLFNPHFEEEFSSWYKFGNAILEFFYLNDDYNLIFAPHINLFNKKGYLNKAIIPEKFFNKDNIHIDLGSHKSVNMSYTLAADIYLGDVSSQVYEYLMTPKPCIFINTYGIDWKKDKHYQNWHLGKVISNINSLEELLKTKENWQKDFLSKQNEAIAYTFDQSNKKNATTRVVESILKLS